MAGDVILIKCTCFRSIDGYCDPFIPSCKNRFGGTAIKEDLQKYPPQKSTPEDLADNFVEHTDITDRKECWLSGYRMAEEIFDRTLDDITNEHLDHDWDNRNRILQLEAKLEETEKALALYTNTK